MNRRQSPNPSRLIVATTNLTVIATRSRNFPETTEFTVNGRRAIPTRQGEPQTVARLQTNQLLRL